MAELKKRSPLQQYESWVKTARATPFGTAAMEGGPVRAVGNDLTALLPMLSDVTGIGKTLLQGIVQATMHTPKNVIGETLGGLPGAMAQSMMEHPLAAAAPVGALKAYRETVPISARTWLHHQLGDQTPFTYATKAEKADFIDTATQGMKDFVKIKNEIRWGRERLRAEKRKGKLADEGTIASLESDLQDSERNLGYMRSNFAEPITHLTGKDRPKRFLYLPTELHEDLGSTGVPHTALGKVFFEYDSQGIPIRVRDVYKFYPKQYQIEGHGYYGSYTNKAMVKEILNQIRGMEEWEKPSLKNIGNTFTAGTPIGAVMRRAGFKKPPYIADIPLAGQPRALNAHDLFAIGAGVAPRKQN